MQSLNRLKSTRKRKEYDFYETPLELCKQALSTFQKDEFHPKLFDVVDAGAGAGVWGLAYRIVIVDDSHLIGIDIQHEDKPYPLSSIYDDWILGDYLDWVSIDNYGMVFGNPPYSLAEEFVRKSIDLVVGGGYVFFLLRLAFLESQKRHFGLFTDYPPKRVYVLSRRPSFFTTKEGRKTTDALSYAMFLFRKGWNGKTELDWMYWNYDE